MCPDQEESQSQWMIKVDNLNNKKKIKKIKRRKKTINFYSEYTSQSQNLFKTEAL